MGFFKHLVALAICLLPVTLEANSYTDPSGSNPLVNLVGDYYMGGNSNGSILCQGAADETGCNAAFAIGFDFDWHGTTYTHGLMSTNGCLKLLTSSTFNPTSDYCSYDVNHLGASHGMNDTLFPFWTDLDLGTALQTQAPHDSTMLFDTGPGVAIFGWYYMREYGVTADTDQYDPQYPNAHNTFEIVLLDQNCEECPGNTDDDENDDYAYIYGNLEISHSNVLVGEKKDSDTFNEKYFFSDNSWCADCVNPNDGTLGRYNFIWDDYDQGAIEGGALYYDGNGVEPVQCESDPLFSTDCTLYSITYLNNQCSIDPNFSTNCAGYFSNIEELLDQEQECYQDASLPFCAGLGIFANYSDMDYDMMANGYGPNPFNANDWGNMDGYDPNTGLVTQDDGSQISIDGSYYSDGYDPNMDYDSMNDTAGSEFQLDEFGVYVPNQYDPMEDDDIEYEYLSGEQKMLVDQGLSLQEAVLITMGTQDIIALGHDPSIQFQGNNPGDLVMDTIGLENYDLEMHDEYMLEQAIENGFEDGFTTSDIWSTEEYMLQEALFEQQFEDQYGEDAYGWTSKDWYDYDVKEFGQDQVDEWYGKEVEFDESGNFEWETYEYALEDEYLMELYYEEDMMTDMEYEVFLSDNIDIQKECPTCDIEAFFDLSDEEQIAFDEIREFDEEAYFDLDVTSDIERFIQEEGLEDLLSEEDLDQFKNEAFAQLDEQYEEGPMMMEEHQDENGPAHFVEPGAPSTNVAREQKQEKQDKQFVGNVGSGVMSLSVAEFNIDFGNSGSFDTGETQQQLETIIAGIIDDGSGSVDDGSSSVDDGSSSGNDGSGSFAQGNDGSNNGYNDGSTQGNMGMLTQESTTGDTFLQEQAEQNMGQQSFDATVSVTDTLDTGAFEVADSSVQAFEQQQEDTLQFVESFDDGTGGGISGVDQQFEDELTTALSTGTGLTEFLSQQTPDYNKYEIEAPTFQEQRKFDAVESLADTMGAEVASANLEKELATIQAGNTDDAQYGDQTVAVAYIGYTPGFSAYTSQIQLADQKSWYGSAQVYPGQKVVDNKRSFYMMAGNTQEKLKEMIYSQYKTLEKQE